ncbi:MAG TPA: hybrid sensor histidine kinase/response regulator [Candidatus Sumerlaeota bacterium]|nr:hybrid sensor histidine kinase/response regulator [Candidatus Sumerlaeota bacterium]
MTLGNPEQIESQTETTPDEEELDLLEESTSDMEPSLEPEPWILLIVDDEEEVHRVTRLVLGQYIFEGRHLQFLSAYNSSQAQEILAQNPQIAVVLLDVVMETEHAGLDVARYIRQDLDNHFVRIILRTGQPGQAPENRVILEYDINDYKEKTELTTTKLYTTITTALRSFRDLWIIERSKERLRYAYSALEEAHRELVELDTLKSSFITITSHELKTPISVARGTLDLVDRKIAPSPPEIQHLLEMARRSLRRLERLVVNAVEMRYAEQYAYTLATCEVAPADLVQKSLEQVAVFVELRNQKLECALPPDLPLLCVDPEKIQDVCINLLMNAIKFTPDGGTITLSAHAPGDGTLHIHVRDTGIGISDDEIFHVFDPFFCGFDPTHHSSGEYEFQKRGLGLGLALARYFVELHGGWMSVESQPGTGSDFYFVLPTADKVRAEITASS